MYKVELRGTLGCEDLMRELESIEQELLEDNQPLAMNLMVLETKIRERFKLMENKVWERYTALNFEENPIEKELSLSEIEAMIPQDLSLFPSVSDLRDVKKRKRTLQTIGMAAALAVVTAIGIFGLASLIQLAISWLA